ncbi:hypothetical protein, partial [Arthrobacter sp. DR-2P]
EVLTATGPCLPRRPARGRVMGNLLRGSPTVRLL